ncbi:MAG TPA: c-type cytochrome domain-containing protein, partial [Pirellulaceae bacterium]
MPRTITIPAFACLLAVFSTAAASDPAPPATPEQEKFFEEKVRPVLAANCQECHGTKKQESGLRLDSRQAIIDGGDSGQRAVVPGDPDRSLLIKAVNHIGDYQMPPKKKLTDNDISALTEWVKVGLPWPAAASAPVEAKKSATDLAQQHRQTHWAYQPVLRPVTPSFQHSSFSIHNSLDNFVAAKLIEKKLTQSPAADRRTLMRRLSFDLVGLPPTPD